MNSRVKNILEWVYCIAIAIIIAIFIKYFVGTPTVVQQDSMHSTLMQGDRLILNKLPKTFKQMPKAGDIITFEKPSKITYNDGEADLNHPTAKYDYKPSNIFESFTYNVLEINKTSYIKRVVGIPGDHIEIKEGKVYKNGSILKEDYLPSNAKETPEAGPFTNIIVPEGTIFAMGDNREVSMDCRAFGCIPVEKVESIVSIRFWPFNKFGKVE